jgi:hypothetical protein
MLHGAILIIIGILAVLEAQRRVRGVEARMAEGDDTYFEEQRTYRSYPRLRSPWFYRGMGLWTVAAGIVLCLLDWPG